MKGIQLPLPQKMTSKHMPKSSRGRPGRTLGQWTPCQVANMDQTPLFSFYDGETYSYPLSNLCGCDEEFLHGFVHHSANTLCWRRVAGSFSKMVDGWMLVFWLFLAGIGGSPHTYNVMTFLERQEPPIGVQESGLIGVQESGLWLQLGRCLTSKQHLTTSSYGKRSFGSV